MVGNSVGFLIATLQYARNSWALKPLSIGSPKSCSAAFRSAPRVPNAASAQRRLTTASAGAVCRPQLLTRPHNPSAPLTPALPALWLRWPAGMDPGGTVTAVNDSLYITTVQSETVLGVQEGGEYRRKYGERVQ